MHHHRRTRDRGLVTRACCLLTVAALAVLTLPAVGRPLAAVQRPEQQTYASPEEAVAALVTAVRANDRAAFSTVLPNGLEQLASHDDVQDKLALLTFAKRLLTR